MLREGGELWDFLILQSQNGFARNSKERQVKTQITF